MILDWSTLQKKSTITAEVAGQTGVAVGVCGGTEEEEEEEETNKTGHGTTTLELCPGLGKKSQPCSYSQRSFSLTLLPGWRSWLLQSVRPGFYPEITIFFCVLSVLIPWLLAMLPKRAAINTETQQGSLLRRYNSQERAVAASQPDISVTVPPGIPLSPPPQPVDRQQLQISSFTPHGDTFSLLQPLCSLYTSLNCPIKIF